MNLDFCPNKKSKEFKEMSDIFGEDKAYFLWMRNKGNPLDKAPNGAESKLFNDLFDYFKGDRNEALKAKAKVYKNEFLEWFGDWTNDSSSNVSKAVDANGEPLVLWHGTENVFDTFEYDEDGTRGGHHVHDKHSFFFTDTEKKAFKYKHAITMPVYLNMKNPGQTSVRDGKYKSLNEYTDRENELIRDPNYDSVFIERYDKEGDRHGMEPTKQWVVKKPNQIKSIINFGTFSTEDDNIYKSPQVYDEKQKERALFADYIDRQNKYLAENYPNYHNVPEEIRKKLKAALHRWFDSQGFKHFKLIFGFDKSGYVLYGRSSDAADRDVSDVKKLENLCGINITDSTPHVLSNETLRTLIKGLFYETKGINQHLKDVAEILQNALQDSGISIQFVNYLQEGEAAHYDYFTNTVKISRSAAFRNDSGLTNVVAQTVLHELIHAATVNTIQHNSELKSQLQNLLDKVKSSVQSEYYDRNGQLKSVYGLTDIYEFLAELSNENFVKLLQGVRTDTDRKDLLSLAISLIKKVINNILSRINKDHKGTAYADAMEFLVKAAFPEQFNIKLEQSRNDVKTVFKSLSQVEAAADRILERFNVLYRQYENIPNKSPRKQKAASQVFEILNKLKQHRDIESACLAIDSAINVLGLHDESIGGPDPSQPKTVYTYLYANQRLGFPSTNVNSETLVDMYRNAILFYKDLLDFNREVILQLPEEYYKKLESVTNTLEKHIIPLWVEASMKVGDDIVDNIIDTEMVAQEEDIEAAKQVAKDWLHKNVMYGDITSFEAYVQNYSYVRNPIIKQVFHLIQHAEQKTLEDVDKVAPLIIQKFQKADKLFKDMFGNWQTVMMEFDEDGIPTGNFVREVNYGQYEKDLVNFRKQLDDDFIKRYGYTFVKNESGQIVNSVTGSLAEDDEWTGPHEPVYVEYLRKIEQFKSERCNRRYIPSYYIERLTQPYDGTLDPLSPEFQSTKFNHGLSPKTLKKYQYYQENINYYLSLCEDKDTGLYYPERLSQDDQDSLDMYQKQLEDISNPYKSDGTIKESDELKTAYEIRAWQKWIGERSYRDQNMIAFEKELSEIEAEAASTGNPKLLQDFIRYNATININPDYIKQTIGGLNAVPQSDADVIRAQLTREALRNLVSVKTDYTRDLQKMLRRPMFFKNFRDQDEIIENNKDTSGDKDFAEAFEESFYQADLLYVDTYGFYADNLGNKVQKQPDGTFKTTSGTVVKQEDLLTVHDFILNFYTEQVIRNGGILDNFIDSTTGSPYVFSGTRNEIRQQIRELILDYTKTTQEDDGTITTELVPSTVFRMLYPKKDKFFNRSTGKTEPTIWYSPTNRFSTTNGAYINDKFDKSLNISEQPNINYVDASGKRRYDNRKAYSEMSKDTEVKDLYDMLTKVMFDAQKICRLKNRQFNYKLPQINAQVTALVSRLFQTGMSGVSARGIIDAITTIEENDENMRVSEDYYRGPDGQVANDVPLKYIRDLKNPENITTDVTYAVIMFLNMAYNFKNKSEIDDDIKLLRYNMDSSDGGFRDVYNRRIKSDPDEISSLSDKNSEEMFDTMLNKHMYGNQWITSPKEGGPGKASVTFSKAMREIQFLESTQMLGVNAFSMLVGFGDSFTRIVSESIAGKYMTLGDVLYSLGYCIIKTPHVIANIKNPLANNKLSAMMHLNGISKGVEKIYGHTNWSRLKKITTELLMGGFSMLDWMANSLLMVAFYHNNRFFEGDASLGIPAGFYTKYELQQAFIKAGKSASDASACRIFTKGLGGYETYKYDKDGNKVKVRIPGRLTLWDAYEFEPYAQDENGNWYKAIGQCRVRPEFEPYVNQTIKTRIATKVKKRGALYNGMNPDNDIPKWKQTIIGSFVGALRSWLFQAYQHMFAGGTDNIVVNYENLSDVTQTKYGSVKNRRRIKIKRTNAERTRRFSYDYETGTPQDQIIIGLIRSVATMFKKIQHVVAPGKHESAKFSYVEKYAMFDSIVYLAMLACLATAWPLVYSWSSDVPEPKNREEAGPASMLNPVDYYDFIKNQYIPNQYYKLAASDILFRIVEAKVSNIDPTQAFDLITSFTTLYSGLKNQMGLSDFIYMAMDADKDPSDIVNQGGYHYYTLGERALYKAFGPIGNMHTWLTYYGTVNNERWYLNKFGKLYKFVGYDPQPRTKRGGKTNDINLNMNMNMNLNMNMNMNL